MWHSGLFCFILTPEVTFSGERGGKREREREKEKERESCTVKLKIPSVVGMVGLGKQKEFQREREKGKNEEEINQGGQVVLGIENLCKLLLGAALLRHVRRKFAQLFLKAKM